MNCFISPKWALAGLVCLSAHAWAGDRPYLATTTAVAEDDDDNVWAVASNYQQVGENRISVGSVEYAFNPTNSIQFEITHHRDREADTAEQEVEIEFKHLFNHIARDGWGLGLSTSLIFAKPQDEVWRHGGVALTVPFSLSLWEGEGLLHLNAGVMKPADDVEQWRVSAAIERKVAKNTTLFTELARQGEQTTLHGGVRYWVKREKLAIDFSLQRVQGAEQRADGFVIGLNLFDL